MPPHFVVYMDNNTLTYVLTTAKLNATGHRWVGELADFHFTIRYRPGKRNADSDGLSRLPLNIDSGGETGCNQGYCGECNVVEGYCQDTVETVEQTADE